MEKDISLKLKMARTEDMKQIKNHYEAIIDATADMERYARWKKNIYPTSDMMKDYIHRDVMYILCTIIL